MSEKLGQDVDFEFSQLSIHNINILLKLFKMRLASDSKTKSIDQYGNTSYVASCIYTTDQLVGFLSLSLSHFNQTPPFTYFTFDDTKCIEFFQEALVSGATIYALASQALIEKGREFKMTNNGIAFDPPNMSEMLNTQHAILLEKHHEKLKLIKQYIVYWDPQK
jgi:hypothetical protein